MFLIASYFLIIVNSRILPLPQPGTNENAEPPMHTGFEVLEFTDKVKCDKAKNWFAANLHRTSDCLEK